MKKETKEFNKRIKFIVDLKASFEEEKWFFEKKVEEKISETGEENYIIPEQDHYQLAYNIMLENPEVVAVVENIREEHPKYGNTRLKFESVKFLIGMADKKESIDAMSKFDSLTKLVNSYLLYEECGVLKVLEKQTLLQESISDTDKAIINAVDDCICFVEKSLKNTKNRAIGLTKPYGDIAKSQFLQLESKTKTIVNKGSKRLIKVFEAVANKTEENK